ncbi:NnrU family protein [Aurantiacibacter suaedae]|uniref:NnrU family protein n=1 Tax=Aurantiacibacter suaedae TaxID=2545755 RepID=UPI0010F96994|nr:NnrU family protein [Aurantiacibacter suaedae]
MDPLTSLLAACVTFVGSHFAMSHPLRPAIVGALGEKGFQAVYSLVSLAEFVWIYFAFKAVAPSIPLWPGFDDVSWALASALTLVAMVLLAGSFVGNPALPAPGAAEAAAKEPRGVFRVTRHPMMWAIGLWALGHLIAAPTARTLVVASAIGFLALVGAHLQDRKKEALMDEAWAGWEARTSYWPKLGKLFSVGWLWWLIGTALWLAFTYAHIHPSGWAAGVWRWVL